jgi:hypothetical protein
MKYFNVTTPLETSQSHALKFSALGKNNVTDARTSEGKIARENSVYKPLLTL